MTLQAPFPWFGGKSRVAHLVWPRFGDVANYVEPFAGSLAMLLGRPHAPRIEAVNDKDAYIANFWRAVQHAPQEVAEYADQPVNENDLTARHIWLVNQTDLVAKIEGDPDYYDAKIAGWWCWGLCCWIGGGWCSGRGPWQSVNGVAARTGSAGRGGKRALASLGNAGVGVHRQRVNLGSAGEGVHRQRDIYTWFDALSERLRRVRVCCGDWARVCTPAVTRGSSCGVFLDPPYADTAGRDPRLYSVDSLTVAHSVRQWAIENGDNPRLRIALCGYEGEHDMPESWSVVAWKTNGGMANIGNGKGKANAHRERIWFSPHCLPVEVARHTRELAFA